MRALLGAVLGAAVANAHREGNRDAEFLCSTETGFLQECWYQQVALPIVFLERTLVFAERRIRVFGMVCFRE
jgi:hypothetical protein